MPLIINDKHLETVYIGNRKRPKSFRGVAFGSYTHSGDAPKLIFDTMENVFKMEMIDLGSFNLREHLVDTTEGLRACQAYGKAMGEKL